MRHWLAAFAAVVLAGPVAAQHQLGAYYAEIGREDMFNSSGVRLGDLGAILQQDRANYHRFGIRHFGDDPDPFFADRAARSQIPALYAKGPGEDLIERIVLQGNTLGILVVVCGRGARPDYLVINFADGDSYRGC
jgi:hypothetical protein